MEVRVDEKGKYYTPHVSKRTVPVTARIQDTIVRGLFHLGLDNRLKDELNTSDTFFAITKAQVIDALTDRSLYDTDVLIVNKQHIVWIFPHETKPSPEQSPT